MTEIYSTEDFTAVTKQKKRCLIFFFIVTGVYIALSVALFVWFVLEPYGSKNETWMLVVECILTGLYAVFAYTYMSIRFSRVNRYRKILGYILSRKSTVTTANFMRFNSDVTVRNGVNFKSMTLVEWSEKEKEYMERYVFLDMEKPRPSFRAGDEVECKTYSNILVAYEIKNRTDLTGTPFDSAE